MKKYRCKNCSNLFALSDVQCDHINPIANTIPASKEEFIDSFNRLHSDKLQILCKPCHTIKTKQDVFQMRYDAALINVSNFLQVYPAHLHNLQDNWSVLQKLDRLIKKYDVETDDKKKNRIYNQICKLQEKYL